MIDALGRRTEYRYDDRGQLIQTFYADDTPDDLSDNPNTIDLYDRGGRLRASIDLSGRVTHFVYDAVDRLIANLQPYEEETLEQLLAAIAPGETPETVDWTQIIYPDQAPDYLNDNHSTQTEYTQDGRVTASIDVLGNRTEYRYDDLGRVTQTIYADDTPDDLSDNPTISVEYDTAGRRIAQTDALGRTTRYQYDDLGRVTQTLFHDGSRSQTSYDALGRRASVTDAEGNITRYFYDSLGRLTGVEDAMGYLTEYRYDELGRLIEAEDANGHVTRYEYDKAGRRTAVELPLDQRSTSTYDAAGNLLTTTDFNGEVTAFDYDAQGRLIEKDYEDDADVSYTYTTEGQIHTITDGRGVTEFGYDALGRLAWRNDPDGETTANGHTIEYEYDGAGNRTAVMTPNGRVDYTYDEQNRLETVTDPEGGTSTYTYDDNGNLIQTEFPNGVIETREYDELGRLVALENQLGDAVISGYRYDLNQAGHRLSVTEADGRQVSYTYDDLYRLTEENINDGERVISYTYDNVGNRLTRTDSIEGTTSYTYDENDRLLASTENGHTTTYEYDDNGNIISQTVDGQTTTYIWDDANRMIQANTADGDEISYEYNDNNIRVSSTVNGVKTSYLVDSNRPYAQVLEEYEDDNLKVFYAHGLDLISVEQDGEVSIYQVDGLGSTRVLTDLDGNVVASYTYEAFGELLDSTGDVENDYLFAGEQFDGELGQYYLRDRYYDQGVGRFTRRDTYEGRNEDPLTLHKYAYVHSDPINGIDPSGFFKEILTTLQIITTLAIITTVNFLKYRVETNRKLDIPVIETAAMKFSTQGQATTVISQQYSIPAIVWGGDLPQTTQHVYKALTGSGYTLGNEQGLAGGSQPITPLLSHIPRKYNEALSGQQWYNNYSPCKGRGDGSDGFRLVCDEYPYLSTAQGGLDNYLQGQVSIYPVLASEQTRGSKSQGARLRSFYPGAGVTAGGEGDPTSWFLTFAVPSEGVSYWIDRKGQRRNF